MPTFPEPETENVAVDFETVSGMLAKRGAVVHQCPDRLDCLMHQRGKAYPLEENWCVESFIQEMLGHMIQAFAFWHNAETPGEWILWFEKVFLEKTCSSPSGRETMLLRMRFGFQPAGYVWTGNLTWSPQFAQAFPDAPQPTSPTDSEFGNPLNWKVLADA